MNQTRHRAGTGIRNLRGNEGRHWPLWTCLLSCLLFLFVARGQSLVDNFADRLTTSDPNGSIRTDNSNATLEPAEPRHGGKRGGHSLWMAWTAEATGIATFTTEGSSFDTLLSAYVLELKDPTKPVLGQLREIAESDDDGKLKTSLVQFGAIQGTTYLIAVDGYSGATGDVRLRWDLIRSDIPLPVIVQTPPDQALKAGDTLVLTVDVIAGDDVKLHWFFNEDELIGRDGNTLTIPNFQRANVGRYRLRLTADKVRFFSAPIEIQINSEGEITTLARDKILDAGDSALIGRDDDSGDNGRALSPALRSVRSRARPAGPIGDTRGFNGTQIFSTLYAQADPGEPAHCGERGGASYWLGYVAPADGPLIVDTTGSDFPTVLAVYTYDEPLLGYQSLREAACDRNSAPDGIASRVEVPVAKGRSYFIVVDGLNGGRGIAHLNYSLPKPTSGTAPDFISTPTSTTTTNGASLRWELQTKGTPPLTYQWFKGAQPVAAGTNGLLEINPLSPLNAGTYFVTVTNVYGAITSAPIDLHILVPPTVIQNPAGFTANPGENGELSVGFEGSQPATLAWFKDSQLLSSETNSTLHLNDLTLNDAGSYVVGISNAAGMVFSAPAIVAVRTPARIETDPKGATIAVGSDYIFEPVVSGTPPLEFTWYRDGSPIPEAVSERLSLTQLDLNATGEYSVEVRNAAGVQRSQVARLTVLAPPRMQVRDAARVVAVGTSITWDLEVEGSDPLEIQWTKAGEPLAGAVGRQLTVVASQPDQADIYGVVVRNPVGTARLETLSLAILFPASIQLDLAAGEATLRMPARDHQRFAVETLGTVDPPTWEVLTESNAGPQGIEVRQPIVDGVHLYRFRLFGTAATQPTSP